MRKRISATFSIVLILLSLGATRTSWSSTKAMIEKYGRSPKLSEEQRTLLAVARLYGLNRDQAILLLAIRDHEDGRPGKELGVENPVAKQWQDGRRSLLVQASFAAETIKRRCPDTRPETIRRFNHGYPGYLGWAEDRTWWIWVRRYMKRYRQIEY